MERLILIVGVLASFGFIIGTLLLGKLASGFNFRTMQISDLCKSAKYAKSFRFLFFVYSLLDVLVMLSLLFYSNLAAVPLIPILLLVAPVLGLPVSLYFDNARHRVIHRVSAVVGFSCALLGSILLAVWVFGQSTVIAVIDLVITFIVSFLLLFALRRHKSVPAVYEYSLFAGELVWKLINLPLLLH